MQAIQAEGVPCFSGTCGEIYLEKAFDAAPQTTRLPVARALSDTSLMFLVDPTLTLRHIEETCRAIERVMAVATNPAAVAPRKAA
jgi:dTDP-4-amino-4,6-dideoxygalactose transaminase